jgi:hypothetical protein
MLVNRFSTLFQYQTLLNIGKWPFVENRRKKDVAISQSSGQSMTEISAGHSSFDPHLDPGNTVQIPCQHPSEPLSLVVSLSPAPTSVKGVVIAAGTAEAIAANRARQSR